MQYTKLFEPASIGKMELKNRIIMAPMGIAGLAEPDGRLTPRATDYFVARARGGVGLIITSGTRVTQRIEYYPNVIINLAAYDSMYVPALSEMIEAVHDYGVKVAVQFTAGKGRNAPVETLRRIGAVAPSALPCFFDPNVIARELTIEEIEGLVTDFAFAAKIVTTAGADAIALNAHVGYLFDGFMTALWNKRTDKYGGDLDGRLRFPIEVIRAIKKATAPDFPIIYKYSFVHYLEGGRDAEEGLEVARRLESAGVNALEIDAGAYENNYWSIQPTTMPPGCLVNLAEMAKKAVSIPVIAVGKMGYPELAERVLREGKADFIALGRPLLADPDWPNKVRDGKTADICPCIGCLTGCFGRTQQRKYISCAVNPATGMEREFTLRPAEKKKRVLVVGGGPGGMEAARVSALRGHEVTLWEKSGLLGGSLVPASAPDFKQDYRRFIDYLSAQVHKLPITLELSKEATASLVKKFKPDVIFIATGSKPIMPQVPGLDKKKAANAVDILLGSRKAGQSVVVVGGGSVGCETALYLAQKGKKVIVLEQLDSVMNDMHRIARMHMQTLLAEAGVKIMTGTTWMGANKGIVVADKTGKQSTIEFDTLVFALGAEPDRQLKESLGNTVPEVYVIGDCVAPRKVMDAVWEAFRIARLV